MPFRDIFGHRRLIELLSRSIARDSLPPSLILSGPEGVGKRRIAMAVAQALNCTSSTPEQGQRSTPALEADACGTCASCTRIARGMHPDVLIVEPGDNGTIKVEQVRDVLDGAGYRPFEGRRRVVIIDQADAMASPAQNAMLKTLEEPPATAAFMLVTSRPDMLLATVRSRCPQLRFRPLSAAEVTAALVGQGRPEAEARAIAAMADGSVGLALDAEADDFIEARDVAVRVLAHATTTDEPRRRIDAAKDLLTKTGSSSSSGREQVAVHLRAMGSLLRDVEIIETGAPEADLANADVRPALDRLSAYRGERGVRAFAAVDQALAALDRNAGVKVVADWLVLHL